MSFLNRACYLTLMSGLWGLDNIGKASASAAGSVAGVVRTCCRFLSSRSRPADTREQLLHTDQGGTHFFLIILISISS